MQISRGVFIAAGLLGVAGLAVAAQGARSAKAQAPTITVYKSPT